MRSELEAKNTAAKGEAGTVAGKLEGKVLVALRQASETGQLFGSVSTRDIAEMIEADGVKVSRSQVVLNAPIKMIGSYKVPIALHPEVEIAVTVNVARSADEAERLARGEDITVRRDQSEAEAQAEAAKKAAEQMFDPDAKPDSEEGGADEAGTAEAEADADATPAKPKKAKAAKAEAKEEE
jgi:large subunit ribosomal protein L9